MTSAGDVERFVYCAHNWELSRRGIDPMSDGAVQGVLLHDQAGASLQRIRSSQHEAHLGWLWMARILYVLVPATLLTLLLTFIGLTGPGLALALLAMVMTAMAAGSVTIASFAERRAAMSRQAANVQPGLVHTGPRGDGPLMDDPEWGIRGTPDYILETEQGFVPVELKSGRTPDTPFDSHILQLGCYLRLVETQAQEPPPHGLLTYPDGTFVIAWTPELQHRLRGVLDTIHAAETRGAADRDHEEPGRCRGCARRAACDQSLV